MRDRRQYCADTERYQREIHHRLTTEYVAEAAEDGLEHRARQEKTGPGPEAFDRGSVQGGGDVRYRYGEGGCVKGGHECDDHERGEGYVEPPSGIEGCGVGVDLAL